MWINFLIENVMVACAYACWIDCRRSNVRWLLPLLLKSNGIHSFCVELGFLLDWFFVSIKLTKISCVFNAMWCGIWFFLFEFATNWIDSLEQIKTRIFLSINQLWWSTAAPRFNFLFTLNFTPWLNHYVGLHCCHCFDVTKISSLFQYFSCVSTIREKNCRLRYWIAPYRVTLSHQQFNNNNNIEDVFDEEYLKLSIRFVLLNLCAHTRTYVTYVMTSTRLECWPTTKN